MQNEKKGTDLVTSDKRWFYQVFIKTRLSRQENLLLHISYNERLDKMRANKKSAPRLKQQKQNLKQQ